MMAGQSRIATGSSMELSGARVLVTGAAGLIGKATITHLLSHGVDVTGLDLRAVRISDCRFVEGDVCDIEVMLPLIERSDMVVHLAGVPGLEHADPVTTYRVNVMGTFVVLYCAAVAGIRKVVYASSINANGLPLSSKSVLPSHFPYDESEQGDITDWYSLSKLTNESTAAMIHLRWGLALAGIRFPLVRDIAAEDGARFGQHIKRLMAENPRRAVCEGWSYLDVRDAARAVFAALTHPTDPMRGYLVAADRTYLATDTENALSRYAPHVPRDLIPGRRVPLDLRRAENDLNFTATIYLDDVAPQYLLDLNHVAAYE
ncbi:MAG: NAD(P)-dependent oxidoreductase [Acidothermus cellulolyticus]|nr:NAD(P)-dependent oxidoreductase [Acidothermus cellulolyticus]